MDDKDADQEAAVPGAAHAALQPLTPLGPTSALSALSALSAPTSASASSDKGQVPHLPPKLNLSRKKRGETLSSRSRSLFLKATLLDRPLHLLNRPHIFWIDPLTRIGLDMCIVPHVPPPPPKNFTPCGSLRCRPKNLIMDDFPDILAGSIDDAMEDMDDVLQDNIVWN